MFLIFFPYWVSDCVVGLRAGDSWQCRKTRMGDSEDKFASTQEEEQEGFWIIPGT